MPTTPGLEPDTAPNGWPRSVLRGFRDGQRDALTAVYRMHVDGIAAYLRRGFTFESAGRHRRFVGYQSAFEFQDALHETFRRAFEPRARGAYDGIRPYAPYLKAIARNVVLKGFRRREALFPEVEPAADLGGPVSPVDPGPQATPEQSVHREQVRELVARFLDTLDAGDRRIVELRFVDGLSQRDAAAELGIGRQRIRTWEARLRARLLTFLRAHGEAGLVPGGGALVPLVGVELARALAEVVR